MADETMDDIMGKHFELAGIEEATSKEELAPLEEKKDEVKSEPKQEELDLGLGDGKEPEKPATEKKDEQPATKEDKPGSGTDGKQEPGKEKEAEGTLNPGDLKLEDGTIVKAGRERRWYEENRISRQELNQANNRLNTEKQRADSLQTKITAIEEASKVIGVADPTEVQKALRLYTDLRTDPGGTLKQLLVDLKTQGYTLPEGIGSGVDTQAILAELDRRLPQKDSVDPNVEVIENIKTEVQSFFTDFPDAKVHEGLIAAVLEAHPNVSLADAYRTLKLSAIDQGFDWSKDLGPQIDAKKAAAEGKTKDETKPLINGRHVDTGNSNGADPAKVITQANSTEDAIKAAMREAGLNIN